MKNSDTGSDPELPIGFEEVFKKTAEYFDVNFKSSFYFSVTKDNHIPDHIRKSAADWGNHIGR